MFDGFAILSGNVYFSHKFEEMEDWVLERQDFQSGTNVSMEIANNTSRTTKQVFDSFTTDDDYGFTKTIVPVRLTQYGDDKLVSRSQAKRLLARIDRFKTVILDFDAVETIGQAFADMDGTTGRFRSAAATLTPASTEIRGICVTKVLPRATCPPPL